VDEPLADIVKIDQTAHVSVRSKVSFPVATSNPAGNDTTFLVWAWLILALVCALLWRWAMTIQDLKPGDIERWLAKYETMVELDRTESAAKLVAAQAAAVPLTDGDLAALAKLKGNVGE
jgi:hypothetical protein